mmetsp:Transcript_27999/g.41658  ORF Transcript_27999/g.41658 Transcript_27999/m.41658 type:complete len:92 (+) Transcript_27999:285-560(+)
MLWGFSLPILYNIAVGQDGGNLVGGVDAHQNNREEHETLQYSVAPLYWKVHSDPLLLSAFFLCVSPSSRHWCWSSSTTIYIIEYQSRKNKV